MTYGAPTTYTKIVPERGCGFILKRIYDLTENHNSPRGSYCKNPTKQDVYCGTSWANRPGFASVLWGALIADRLIESDDGKITYKPYRGYFSLQHKPFEKLRAKGHYEAGNGYTVRYHLTPKGRGILFDMMARVNKIREEKKAFCERNGIEFGTGRTLNTVGSVAEYDAKKDDERDILEKEALDCAKLAANYVGENQKLRAEKSDMNERLKKIVARLEWLEDEISDVKSVLADIIEEGQNA